MRSIRGRLRLRIRAANWGLCAALFASFFVFRAQAQVFQAPEAFWTGSEPIWVAVGDFNGDGKSDMAVSDYNAGTVSVLLSNGDGTFGGAVAYTVGSSPTQVVVDDFNGDGQPDIAVINAGSGTVSILLGNGDGTFQAAVNYAVVPGASYLAAGDFNGDGKVDLAINGGVSGDCNSGSTEYMSILLGIGDGTFQPAVNYPTGSCRRVNLNTYIKSTFWIAIGDVNGDGKPDAVLAAHSSTTICQGGFPPKCQTSQSYSADILLGNGDGTFQASTSCCSFTAMWGLAVGDFNGDGKLDVATLGSNGAIVFLNNGAGAFQAPVTYAAGGSPSLLTATDIDGNGTLDLVVTNVSGGVTVLLGKGDGTFPQSLGFAAGADLWQAAAGDFNGDGKPDLAVINTVTIVGIPTVTVLLNQGNGRFAEPNSYSVGSGAAPVSVTTADFNGDGKLDLAIADYSSTTPGVSVLLGNGDGSYQAEVLYAAGKQPSSVAFGDFNGDHKPDLVAANSGGGVSVLLGNGDGTFQSAVSYGTVDAGTSPSVVIGDLNGDGKLDLVVTDGNGHADVLLGNGDGTFRAAVSYTTGGACTPGTYLICLESPAIGDFNGDGKLDLAVPDASASMVDVLLGNGDGTFQSAVTYSAHAGNPAGINAALVGDFNGDGKLDLAVAANNGEQLLLGNGDGTFQAPTYNSTTCCPTALVGGDFNGDGKLDMAAVGNGELTLLLGNGDGTFQQQFYAVGNMLSPSGIAAGDFNGDHTLDLAVTPSLGDAVALVLNKSGFYLSVTDGGSSGGGSVTSNPPGIDCGAACTVSFAAGTQVALTPTPALGFGFAGWSGACTGMGSCTVTMSAFETVTAAFEPVFALLIADSGTGGGAVTSNPSGITCGSTCSANFLTGTVVSLTATPDSISNFAGWSGGCSGTGICNITMNAAASATANFASQDFSLKPASGALTLQPGGQGADVITLAGVNGPFNSAIQLTCTVSGSAPALGCLFSSASVTPDANSVTSTMTITASSASAIAIPQNRDARARIRYALWMPLLCGIVMAGWKKRRREWVLFGALLLLFFLEIGCGGGNSAPPQPTPRNYMVTVTATSGAITHTTQVAVTVQ